MTSSLYVKRMTFAAILVLCSCLGTGEESVGSSSGGSGGMTQEQRLLNRANAFKNKACSGFTPTSSTGAPCTTRDIGSFLGDVDGDDVSESSAIAISGIDSERLYQINDSGSDDVIYFSDLDGSNPDSVEVSDYEFRDVEDMDVAPCTDSGSCLYIADTGNNSLSSSSSLLKVFIVKEQASFGASVASEDVISVRFPDNFISNIGALDIEAFAVHPDTLDFYFLTKAATTSSTKFEHARLLRVRRADWEGASGTVQMSSVGAINIPVIYLGWLCEFETDVVQLYNSRIILKDFASFFSDSSKPGAKTIVTSMDFNDDGDILAVGSYGGIWEFDFDESDLSGSLLRKPKEHQYNSSVAMHDLRNLPQIEAITFVPSSDSIVFTTEISTRGTFIDTPIYESSCTD